jgi:predicted DNA-binding transcriptional regulator AlpA
MDQLLTLRETASRLNVSEATLRWWRHCSDGPKGFRAGRRVFYRVSDVENWIEERIAAEELGRSHK